MIPSTIFSVATFALLASFAQGQNPTQQRVIIYDGPNCSGPFLELGPAYWSNLDTLGWNNRAESVDVTGTWLFYDFTQYNQGLDAPMEYIYNPGRTCVNLNNIANRLSSLRYAGSPANYQADSFTLYENVYFQGEEEYVLTDTPNLTLERRTRSVIITGTSSWTIFDSPNYRGNTLCFRPGGGGSPNFIYDTRNIGAPWGTIKSIRKGCTREESVAPQAEALSEKQQFIHGQHIMAELAPPPEENAVNLGFSSA